MMGDGVDMVLAEKEEDEAIWLGSLVFGGLQDIAFEVLCQRRPFHAVQPENIYDSKASAKTDLKSYRPKIVGFEINMSRR